MKKNPYKGADRFTQAAKRAGFPARSVFKLEEIDRRVRLLRPGMKVLDLGAAPGSWTLYAAQRVGLSGRVVAIDLEPIHVGLPPQVTFAQGDALSIPPTEVGVTSAAEAADPDAAQVLASFAPYDVVLSDMAPRTTGNRLGDQTRSFELFMAALAVAGRVLRPGGTFVGKIFMGEDFAVAKRALKQLFREERGIRPEGTRTSSYEVFLVGIGRHHATAEAVTEASA